MGMNKSTAANISRQARSSAAAMKRASKAAAKSAACQHDGGTVAWSVPTGDGGEYHGTDCVQCGANLTVTR